VFAISLDFPWIWGLRVDKYAGVERIENLLTLFKIEVFCKVLLLAVLGPLIINIIFFESDPISIRIEE
jgi:hypothetical protein